MNIAKWLLVLLIVVAAVALGAGRAGLLEGSAPTDLGVQAGRLKPPSLSDNSVSSQAVLHPEHPRRNSAQVAPLAMRGDGPATLGRIRTIVEAMPGAKLVKTEPGYLRAEFTTRLMRFVDDVEFWYDPAAGVVQVRSASRLGESDLGVNRQRIEAVRAALAASS